MTQSHDPYENALAERMNRTLKDEFELGRGFINHKKALKKTKKAIKVYNNLRIHASCHYLTPSQARQKVGKLKKRWKKYKFKLSSQTEMGNAGAQPIRDMRHC